METRSRLLDENRILSFWFSKPSLQARSQCNCSLSHHRGGCFVMNKARGLGVLFGTIHPRRHWKRCGRVDIVRRNCLDMRKFLDCGTLLSLILRGNLTYCERSWIFSTLLAFKGWFPLKFFLFCRNFEILFCGNFNYRQNVSMEGLKPFPCLIKMKHKQ